MARNDYDYEKNDDYGRGSGNVLCCVVRQKD